MIMKLSQEQSSQRKKKQNKQTEKSVEDELHFLFSFTGYRNIRDKRDVFKLQLAERDG